MKQQLIGLPVMLHNEAEIEAFKRAKPRIEELMSKRGFDVQVGAFCYFLPFTLSARNREAALVNQGRHQLPIIHIQLPIDDQYALTHRPSAEEHAKFQSLDSAMEHAGRIVAVSSTNQLFTPDLDIHAGVYVYPELDEPNPFPGSYSVSGFLNSRDNLVRIARERIGELQAQARTLGLNIVLENEPVANFEPASIYQRKPSLILKPFGSPDVLRTLCDRHTLDLNHFAATRNAPARFRQNGIPQQQLFDLLGVQSEGEFTGKFCNSVDYATELRAIHLSNTEGIGVHLTDPQDIAAWGKDGTIEGSLSRKELRAALDTGFFHGIPVVLEVDYDIKKIPQNEFIEADRFLHYVTAKEE